MNIAIAFIFALFTSIVKPCQSTIFGQPGDEWAGGNALLLGRHVNQSDLGIAHRWWPLGSTVIVQHVRSGRMAFGVVLDRGPYGATTPEGDWALKLKPSDPGRWRGCADLTPALARRIGHDGFDAVRLWRLE